MAFDIIVRDKIAASIETKLKAIEVRATSTTSAINRMKAAMGKVGTSVGLSSANKSFTTLSNNVAKTNRQITALSQGFTKATNNARRLLSGALLLQGAESFVNSLDAYQNLQNRLLGVSKVVDSNGIEDAIASQERLNEVTNNLFGIAERARVPVGSLAKTYRRLDNSLKAVGASQKETLRVTETAAKLLSLSGANAGEAASALLQLSQAFNKGKLDGDEFRSVAELMPRAIEAITKVLGISKKEIFDYSREGKITIDVLRQAFSDLATEVDQDFSRLPRTVGQAFTQLGNTVAKAFGESSGGGFFLKLIISGVDWLKNNLPTLINLMKAFVAVMATQYLLSFGTQLGTINGWFDLIAQAISAVVAYFTFFADKIKVTTDGLATLQDVFIVFYQTITGTESAWMKKLFSPETAQYLFDYLKEAFVYVIGLANKFLATIKGIYSAFASLSGSEVVRFLPEAFNSAIFLVQNALLDLLQWVLKKGGEIGTAMVNGVISGLKKLALLLGASAASLPIYGKEIKSVFNDIYLGLNKIKLDKPLDLGITELAEKWRVDIAAMSPTLLKFSDAFNKSYESTLGYFEKFQDSILKKAESNANARIEQEKRVQDAMTPNADALRGVGITGGGGKNSKVTIAGNKKGSGAVVEYYGAIKRLRDAALGETKESKAFIEEIKETSVESTKAKTSVVNLANTVKALSFVQPANSVNSFVSITLSGLARVRAACVSTGSVIRSSQSSAWQAATHSVQSYANTAIYNLNKVQQAAKRSQSVSTLSLSTGGGDGRDFTGSFGSFASGGYTGNRGRNQVAGVVHGQEYVMPADTTAKYRPVLEAMQRGDVGSGGVGSTTMNVVIENYGSSTHEVEQISANEVRIIAREAVRTEASNVIARELSNPNSRVSKSMNSNTKSGRRR